MKLIKPSFEVLNQLPGLDGIYKQIELAGRTCYKSENKITEDSAKGFVSRMVASGHYAMLEHGTIYLINSIGAHRDSDSMKLNHYCFNPYSKYKIVDDVEYVTTNYRVLLENNWLNDLEYLGVPTECHEKRITVRFICDRGVSHEFVRHRVFSFAQESTRYCNYSNKDKFGHEVTFIIPIYLDQTKLEQYGPYHFVARNKSPESVFMAALNNAEKDYFELLNWGWTPQQARAVLPNALKTELIMTGFVSDWQHFFDLRSKGTTGKPHPQAEELATPLYHEFQKLNLIN